MIHIAICDDEKHMSDHVKSFVSDFFRKKNREISLRMFSIGEELLNYNGQIDILFLDIQMEDMDGMETARKLRADQYRGFLVTEKEVYNLLLNIAKNDERIRAIY